MAITFISVKILAPPNNTTAACNGGVFGVDVEVHGTSDGAGGRYLVELWDDDLFVDDLLDNSVAIPIAPNQNFTVVTNMTLQCDANCDVVGAIGSSGESTAEVYAHAVEQRPGGAKMGSQPVNLICDDDLPPPEKKQERYEEQTVGKT